MLNYGMQYIAITVCSKKGLKLFLLTISHISWQKNSVEQFIYDTSQGVYNVFPLIVSFSAHADYEPYLPNEAKESLHFDFFVQIEDETIAEINSTYPISEIEHMDLDPSEALSIGISSLKDGYSDAKFTVSNKLRLQITCTTDSNNLEYRFWSPSVTLYGEDHTYRPNRELFSSRIKTPDMSPFHTILSTNSDNVHCHQDIINATYTIEYKGEVIKTIVVLPSGSC